MAAVPCGALKPPVAPRVTVLPDDVQLVTTPPEVTGIAAASYTKSPKAAVGQVTASLYVMTIVAVAVFTTADTMKGIPSVTVCVAANTDDPRADTAVAAVGLAGAVYTRLAVAVGVVKTPPLRVSV
jgi:hypothetical protein